MIKFYLTLDTILKASGFLVKAAIVTALASGSAFLVVCGVLNFYHHPIIVDKAVVQAYAEAHIKVEACHIAGADVGNPSDRILYKLQWKEGSVMMTPDEEKVDKIIEQEVETLMKMSFLFDMDKVCKMWEYKLNKLSSKL
jgi:hypothetical protein